MPVYTFLNDALHIMQIESNWRKWGPHIEALPENAQVECRSWLRQEALKRNYHERRERDKVSPDLPLTKRGTQATCRRISA